LRSIDRVCVCVCVCGRGAWGAGVGDVYSVCFIPNISECQNQGANKQVTNSDVLV
jgi:hypothetical protein